MGLRIYDADKDAYTSRPFRAVINGHLGGAHEEKIYLRNDDVTKWYTNIVLSVRQDAYDALGELGSTGFSFKFIYGERRPTEAEWSAVVPGHSIQIPDIGSASLADTYTYHPIWVRVYSGGNQEADIIDVYTIRLTYLPRVVG